MRGLPRHLFGGVAIQVVGAFATFAIGIAIAVWQGPEAQGRYGLLRTAADLLLALALFGLPQGMVHAINQRGTSPAALQATSLRYAAVLLAAALIVTLLSGLRGATALLPGWIGGPLALLALLAGSVGWVLQSLLRALLLSRGTVTQFAWASVWPALTLLSGVLVLQFGGSQRYELALAVSGLASVILTSVQLRTLRKDPVWNRGGPPPLTGLLRDGTHAFAQSAGLALQPWLTLQLMQWQGATTADVGHFVFAAYVLQAFALPTSFVAPLLFARISAAAGAGRRYAAAGIVGRVLGLSTVAALLASAALPLAVPWLFGPAYAPAVTASVLLALAGPLLIVNRLGVSVLFGRGRFRIAGLHAVVRALGLPAAMWLTWRVARLDVVSAAAAAWLLVELVAALMLLRVWFALWEGPLEKGS